MSKKELKNYLPEIKEALKNNNIIELLYEIENKAITDFKDVKIILDLCEDFNEDPYSYLSGQRDTEYLYFLANVAQIEYDVAHLPNIKPEKKNKTDEKGKVLKIDFGKNNTE